MVESDTKTFPEASVTRLKFPETARKYFIDNWLELEKRSGKNPYDPSSAVDLEAWKILIESLIVAQFNGSKSEKIDSEKILSFIKESRFGEYNKACVVIENFPRDPEDKIIAVPKDPTRLNGEYDVVARGKESTIGEAAMSGLLQMIGQFPQQLKALHQGAAFQHNTVRQGFVEEPNSSMGGGAHAAHTEGASFSEKNSIEYLSLLCMQNKHTQTTILPIEDIFKLVQSNLTQAEIETLKSPYFKFKPSSVYKGSTPEGFLDEALSPILFLKDMKFTEPSDTKRIRFDYETSVHPDCPSDKKQQAQEALDKISNLLNENMRGITLKPGELFLGNNNLFAHGKAPQHPEDNDRWLIRSRSRFNTTLYLQMYKDMQLQINCAFMDDARVAHYMEKEATYESLKPELKEYLSLVRDKEFYRRYDIDIKVANYLVTFGEVGMTTYEGEPHDFSAYHMGIRGLLGQRYDDIMNLHGITQEQEHQDSLAHAHKSRKEAAAFHAQLQDPDSIEIFNIIYGEECVNSFIPVFGDKTLDVLKQIYAAQKNGTIEREGKKFADLILRQALTADQRKK